MKDQSKKRTDQQMPENTKNKTEAKDCQKSQNRSDNCKDDGKSCK